MNRPQWRFARRFRRNAYGADPALPIARIGEAVAEIRRVARRDGCRAADGAVLFLVRLVPAMARVDGASGRLGTAANHAIQALAPLIAQAPASDTERRVWLERLWPILMDTALPNLHLLGDYWGALCATHEIASDWADRLLPELYGTWVVRDRGTQFYLGTTACLSALLAAQRHDELLTVLDEAPITWWHYRRWGVQALVAQGRKAEAIRYAEASRSPITPETHHIALACETILLSSGLQQAAYDRYALDATRAPNCRARFHALRRKYPDVPVERIVRDLLRAEPAHAAQWLAAAREVGRHDLADALAAARHGATARGSHS